MIKTNETILLFTKYPTPGKSKTRLIPLLGAEKAADIQHQMSLKISETIARFAEKRPCGFTVYYDGTEEEQMKLWLGDTFKYISQVNGDLGNRMTKALKEQLEDHSAVLLCGADCPDLNEGILQAGLDGLLNNDVVIGPAYDGGYYLIGVRSSVLGDLEQLFTGINWGTETVLHETLTRIEELKLQVKLLTQLHDIDTPDDLRYLNYHPNPE